jgi:hypothetical protein
VDGSKVGKLRIDVYTEVTVSEIGMKYKIVVEGKHLAEFVQEACVPDLVEGLGDVNESSGTELMSINGVVDDPNETMDLFER